MTKSILIEAIIEKCKSHSPLTDIEYDTLAKILNLIYGDYKEEDKMEAEYPMNLLNAIRGTDNSCIPDEKSLKIISENLEYVFDNLIEAKEASILKLRCKSYYSLGEVAKIFDLTKERVRQIEARALRKLRHPSRYNKIFSGHKLLDDIEEKNNVLTLKKNELSDLITESMNHIKILSDALNNVGIDVKTNVNTEISYSLPLDEVGFSIRTYNCLKRAGYNTIKDICNATESDVMQVRNLGRRCFQEIRDKLLNYGLSFKPDDKKDNWIPKYVKEEEKDCDDCDDCDEDSGLCETCVHYNGFGNKCSAGFLCNMSMEGCKYYHET